MPRRFVYAGLDQPVMMVEVDGATETLYYYHYDALGSVIAMTDASGNIVERYEYTAFGETTIYNAAGSDITATGSSIGNPYMFTARRYDEESGLYYYRARMYNPELGRFMQPDPIGYLGGINLYAYVSNNPLNYRDPFGLLEVYIWDYMGSKERWGHASLMLDDGTYISWWPGTSRDYLIEPYLYTAKPTPRTFDLDVMEEGTPPNRTITINGLDEGAISDWWDDFSATENWRTLCNNCSTATYKALRAGGSPYQLELIWRPDLVGDYAEDLSESKNTE